MARSVIPFNGYGKGTVNVNGVYAGYITSSGNYFTFTIPISISKSNTVSIDITSAAVYKESSMKQYDTNNFDTSYKDLVNTGIGIRCELKYKQTQSNPSTSGTINIVGTITIS